MKKETKPKRKSNKKFAAKKQERFVDDVKPEGPRRKRQKFGEDYNAETKAAIKSASVGVKWDRDGDPRPQRRGPGGKRRPAREAEEDEEKPPILQPPALDPKTLEKYSRGSGVNVNVFRNEVIKKRFESREKKIAFSTEEAARNEILLTEETGHLEADGYEETAKYTQKQIVKAVDITSATKHFELNLEFGPYKIDYTRNGRQLLLGGRRGHVAAFDWVTKKLMCEINVMEDVHDLKWLHTENMFATAQKEWVYIYDNEGTEIHCVKQMHKILRLEYLPYHFLLASASESGHLNWLDVSMGKLVGGYNARMGRLPHMTHNPFNGTLVLGHPTGVVTLWSPTVKEPLAKMLCQKTAIQAMSVDPSGRFIATAGMDRSINVWDIRAMRPLQSYRVRGVPSALSFSHKGCLATGNGNDVQIFKDCVTTAADGPYLTFRCNQSTVRQVQFCPFEDVLGIGAERGFSSILVPGAGEANFDSYEQNPFRTKSQRKEAEVKSLLEKVPPEFITLDPLAIAEVDVPTMHAKIEAQKKLLYMKPPKIDYKPRRQNKKGAGLQAAKTKKILREEAQKEFIKLTKNKKITMLEPVGGEGGQGPVQPPSVLDRFKPKQKKRKALVDS